MKDAFDREITYLRLSVTELCSLRCRYCMGEEGVCKKRHEDMLREDEMIAAVEAAATLGITKVRITGGEPLVKKNIVSICRRTAAVPGIREVCLTTNGIALPEYAAELKAAGVRRINISLDTLSREKYAEITRRDRLADARKGLECALSAGFEKIKINTVLIGGFNDDEIVPLAGLTKQYPVDVRFIELMPMREGFPPEAFIPAAEVLRQLPEAEPLPSDGGVAKLYRLPGAMGNLGLISPLSAQFCARCDRLRLTADGRLKPCLHSAAEFPIKGLDREEMTEQMRRAILCKPEWHGVLSPDSPSRANRDMNRIGG